MPHSGNGKHLPCAATSRSAARPHTLCARPQPLKLGTQQQVRRVQPLHWTLHPCSRRTPLRRAAKTGTAAGARCDSKRLVHAPVSAHRTQRTAAKNSIAATTEDAPFTASGSSAHAIEALIDGNRGRSGCRRWERGPISLPGNTGSSSLPRIVVCPPCRRWACLWRSWAPSARLL